MADYYQALFLNAALPGGVLGDVDRAVRHGRDVGDVGLAVKAVVMERSAGQVVLVGTGVVVLLLDPASVPAPARAVGAGLLAVTAAAALAIGLAARRRTAPPTGLPDQPGQPGPAAGRWAGAARSWATDARRALLAPGTRGSILLASFAVVVGHLATFVAAARVAGATADVARLAPLMLLALLAMAIPLNIGGWGPREGVTAWAFGAAGLSASLGLTIAVVYGLLAFVASLPGAGVLLVRWITRTRTVPV